MANGGAVPSFQRAGPREPSVTGQGPERSRSRMKHPGPAGPS
ncbi:hypothetical protein KCH_42410 [Kitasatospora cheerisanensis KCTC 2395]|uniref:Uncharacterized protein n=1 Tax=Kitasatospora cheerisanensis KCTC 2395 TaxID=1348663 RepID=A0A066Z2P3_9ACTN|nr:hypothetical protein KCH_42410 [Kitasatospora cheerisanensis KCTC 2395]